VNRSTSDAPTSRPFHHSGLGVTVEVPDGWSVEGSETFPLQLFAPARLGYRSNLMFSHERFSPPTAEGLAGFLASVRAAQRRDYTDFVEESAEEVEIDGRPAILQRYHWGPEGPAPAMAQLLALAVVEAGLLLEVDGATTAALGHEMRPLLEEILLGIRLGARRPGDAGPGDAGPGDGRPGDPRPG